jgi:hypothetical protein
MTQSPFPDWHAKAACRTEDPDLFFPRGNGPEAKKQTHRAKAVCFRCPVRLACGQAAIDRREPIGVWGGLSEKERRKILRIRISDGEAEPRKGGRPRAECGTASAYDRHVKYGEPIDEACRAAHTASIAERRARTKQAPKKREPAKCGTRGGYQRHLREKTEICAPCRQANTDADNRLRRTGTTKQLAA